MSACLQTSKCMLATLVRDLAEEQVPVLLVVLHVVWTDYRQPMSAADQQEVCAAACGPLAACHPGRYNE